MNLNEYYSKLEKSKEYKDFIEQYPNAYLCSSFFMLDKENNTKEIHFDYYIKDENKMFSFKINLQNQNPTSIPHQVTQRLPPLNSKKSNNKSESEENYYTGDITISPTEFFDKRVPDKLNLNKKMEIDNFEKLIVEIMEKENLKETVKKFLYSFQSVDGKNLLFATVFLSKLALLKVSIDISKMEIIDFDKKSFFDIISFVKK